MKDERMQSGYGMRGWIFIDKTYPCIILYTREKNENGINKIEFGWQLN
jgi:hypothetical protein